MKTKKKNAEIDVTENPMYHDTWKLLKVFGLRNMKEDAYLHETLPEGVILYEPLDSNA